MMLSESVILLFKKTNYQESLSLSLFLGGGNVTLKIITKNIAIMPAAPILPTPFILPDRPAESARYSVVVNNL
jgi:hypothetical protein